MNVFSLLVAIDSAPIKVQNFAWRDALMRLFFKDISQFGVMIVSKDDKGSDFCGWQGVKCEANEIRAITYRNFQHGNFNIRALPHTTRRIEIEKCEQTFQIDTRSLPRNLKEINLETNQIHGRLDLTTFPENLEYARFQDNNLTGPIILTRLPKSLKRLFLEHNKINQKTVFYANLPDGIEIIRLKAHSGSNRIGDVRAVYPEHAVKNKGIFRGMKEKNVH